MNTTWFCSDTHYGHIKIIDYCKRPFASVEEMNAQLINRYRQVVQPDDRVFILGDFAFCNPGPIFEQLPGHKHLIVGNHDWKRLARLQALPWVWIKDTFMLDFEGQQLWLSHYPHRSWPHSGRGAWHLHGHTHGDIAQPDPRTLDVGVDCHAYAPISFDQVRQYMSLQPPAVSHHPGRTKAD